MTESADISPEQLLKASEGIQQDVEKELKTAKTPQEAEEMLPGAVGRAARRQGLDLSDAEAEKLCKMLAPMLVPLLTEGLMDQFAQAGAFTYPEAQQPGTPEHAAAVEASVPPAVAQVEPPRKRSFAERFHQEQ